MKRQRTEPSSESKDNGTTPDTASDALTMSSVQGITATLSVILHTLQKLQAEVTDIKETQGSIISAQRHLSNQVLDLQNHKKKFFTGLRDLPLEVVIQIFAWIPVRTVFKYMLLSRVINEWLLTSQFAVLNMQASDFMKGSKPFLSTLWLVLPQSYQTVVARAMPLTPQSSSQASLISYLTALKDIIIENSALTGDIPDVFGSLTNLRTLRLRDNKLRGPLPCSLNLLSGLRHLDLLNNQLSGDFPALPNLNNLETFNISHNDFTGPVPTVFGNTHTLAFFYAAHNNFSVLPVSICQFTSLVELHIGGNTFSCEVPPGIWNLTALTSLEMSGCQISGSLAGVGNLRNLQTLGVSNNQFGGDFPSREIVNLHNLEELHLAGNQFSGGEVLDMTERDDKITMCLDRDFQRTYVVREGFHKCHDEHDVTPFTGDFTDSEPEDSDYE
ncbi:hypothetical protein HDU81_005560 [Chytriomyces hyalinus]|nr:hypothetical protein HDU81_005560 [Chytriomyces hyalinus]